MTVEQEDEQAFLRRRIDEEGAQASRSACLVRSVHEDLAELYEERCKEAAAETAALMALLNRLP